MSEPSAPHKVEPPVQISTEGVHPEPRKTGHRLADFSIALAAIVISLISLGVGIHHGKVQERLVAANSWPFLQWGPSHDDAADQQRFSIYIVNSGAGPALLKGLVVRYKDQPVRGWYELLRECCGVERTPRSLDLAALGFVSGGQPKGVIQPNGKVTLISLARLPHNLQVWEQLSGARRDLEFEACYCSILGECWKSDLQTLDPQATAECRGGPDDYVEIGAGFDEAAVPLLLRNE
jgi:hypothetical protein